MYERFTDRARKIIQLATQEAQRFNHEYIGTEHMLLGLVKEGSGVAANVLKNLDIDLRKIRLEVEKLVQHGPGGGQVFMGRLPLTPRARRAVELSVAATTELRHNYVGTEHLLLGLMADSGDPLTVAIQALNACGVSPGSVREEVLNLLGHNLVPDEQKQAREATEDAELLAAGLGRTYKAGGMSQEEAVKLAATLFDKEVPEKFPLETVLEALRHKLETGPELCRAWFEKARGIIAQEMPFLKYENTYNLARRLMEGMFDVKIPESGRTLSARRPTVVRVVPLSDVMEIWGESVIPTPKVVPGHDRTGGFTANQANDWSVAWKNDTWFWWPGSPGIAAGWCDPRSMTPGACEEIFRARFDMVQDGKADPLSERVEKLLNRRIAEPGHPAAPEQPGVLTIGGFEFSATEYTSHETLVVPPDDPDGPIFIPNPNRTE